MGLLEELIRVSSTSQQGNNFYTMGLLEELIRVSSTSQQGNNSRAHRFSLELCPCSLLHNGFVGRINKGIIHKPTRQQLPSTQSSQEDVQEMAATALATFVVIVNQNARVDGRIAEAVLRGGGIRLLLNLARSCREGLQSEATKAITNLSVNADVAKAVVEGGIGTLSNLARSMYRSVAEEAARGLWNLSVTEEHKHAIAAAGGVKALVDLIFKWRTSGDRVLECAAGALANIATDDKLGMEVAELGGVRALAMLAQNCESVLVLKQTARALANLASLAYDNGTQAAVGVARETGAVQALVELTYSNHEGVRTEAAGALWNLSFDDERNSEAIAVAGGVEALVSLAQSSLEASESEDLQEIVAGPSWRLAISEVMRDWEYGGIQRATFRVRSYGQADLG